MNGLNRVPVPVVGLRIVGNERVFARQGDRRLHVLRTSWTRDCFERHIVASHYFQGVRFKDLGSELGVSEPRISQLHSRALGLLRAKLA